MPEIPDVRGIEVEERLKILAEFEALSAWNRSKKGNLWRSWDDYVLTIFRRHGRYRWSYTYDHPEFGDRTCFSKEGYDTVADAKDALAYALAVAG